MQRESSNRRSPRLVYLRPDLRVLYSQDGMGEVMGLADAVEAGQIGFALEVECQACAKAESEVCPEHCEHSDCDDHCCLICGVDLGKHWACMAESWADAMEDR